MDLEAIVLIQRLKYRYARALDTKSWVEFADTLTVDATAIYGEQLSFDSRDSFVSFLENTLGSHIITEHQCGQPEIDVDGDTATGIWCLADTVVIPEDGMLLRGSASITTDTPAAATVNGESPTRATSGPGNRWWRSPTCRVSD